MAFRKRRMRSRRRRTRRRRIGKRMTARRVRRIIGAELKFGYQPFNGTAPADNDENIALTLINQGVMAGNRVGNWIQVINIHGSLQVEGQVAGAVGVVNCRAFIFRWNEDQSSQLPTLDTIMESVTAPMGPYNFGSRGKFKIVWSRVFTIINDDDNPQFSKKFPIYIRLNRSPKTTYQDGAPKKNQYFFWIFSETNEPTSIPNYRLDITTRWTDS